MPIRIRGLRLPAKLTGLRSTPPDPVPEPIQEVILPVYEPEPDRPYVAPEQESDEEIVVPRKPKTKITNRTVALNPLRDE